ncbi:uncharacterized protein LOC124322409 [Daphnia pulicaria]|uniref:uncharacterized protein LOC124322409 n=1 Tax=Daphnia pulicaria TaxID=35523 RepID=UPI001EEB143D|nr:uncharacterized protein LOC124322409 [Daphnia pulicaria]
MVFDTTSSNTGKHAGSCISLESALGRSIMWLACRHHVYEIHVKHVSDHINGARNSPSDSLCVRFQKDFNSLDKSTEDLEMLDHSELSNDLENLASSVIEWGTRILEEDVFSRSDYKELLELTLVYLGGVVFPFSFHKPG